MFRRIQEQGLTAPGCNWLGPFNPLDAPPPTCHSDQIAKEHDFDYHFATSASEVRKADRRAIAGFTGDLVVNKSPYALLGLVGFGAKYCVETATGVIYPTGLNRFIKKKQDTCKEIRNYHKKLDSIQEAEEENYLNWKSSKVEVVNLPSSGTKIYRSKPLFKNPALSNQTVPIEETPSYSSKREHSPTYNPYKKPRGYKNKDTWTEGPNIPEGWSWFQQEIPTKPRTSQPPNGDKKHDNKYPKLVNVKKN
uniref:Capsid protein VP1 n=1 Tax=Lygus hesperus TaxID=30085 RepID=A0A0A9XIJ7_LYGHE